MTPQDIKDLNFWYSEFKTTSKNVLARVKKECPQLKQYSNVILKKHLHQDTSTLHLTLTCGKVVSHQALASTGLVAYCNCCNIISEIDNRFSWVNYMIHEQNGVKYVGHTTNLKQRLALHTKHQMYIPNENKVTIHVILSEQSLFDIYKPRLNKSERLNRLARVFRNQNVEEIMIDGHSSVKQQQNKVLLDMEKSIEALNELQLWCYDASKQICECNIKCALRKYHNKFNNRPFYYPIDESKVDPKYLGKKIQRDVNLIPVDDIFDMQTVIKTRKPFLKESTLSSIPKSIPDLNYPFLCFKNLDNMYSSSTVQKMIGYILSYISVLTPLEKKQVFGDSFEKHCFVYYKAKFILDKVSFNEKATGQLSEIEKKNWVSFDVLLNILERLKEKDLQKYVVLYLYLYQNTLRSDFYNIKWKNYNVNDDNFIDFPNRLLILNHPLKVDRFQAYRLQPDVYKLLKTFTSTLTSDFLFVKKNKTPFNPKTFAQYILLFIESELHALGIYHKRVGVQMLRKIVVSETRKKGLTVVESIQLAKDMNHSEYMSQFYYCKK